MSLFLLLQSAVQAADQMPDLTQVAETTVPTEAQINIIDLAFKGGWIMEGKVESALNLCRSTNTPSARMIEKGITRLGRPMNDVLVAIENVGNLEVAKLEKGFPVIATTAAGAPMLGFLGTVTGMVRAFFDMANAGTNVDVSLLSSGIYEALVTTVGGLVVGIIALFAYNYLVSQVDNVVNKMEARTMEFMDLLNEPAN